MTHRQRHNRRRRSRPRYRHRAALGLIVLLAIAGMGALSAVGYVAIVAASAPNIDKLKPIDKGTSSEIFAADGSRLGFVQSDEIRTPVPRSKMPKRLRQAVVAIEDERFWTHKGVDPEGIVRAGVENLRSGKAVQGGSTITQQLARALYIEDAERNFERKIREAKLASELEQRRSKDWILTEYLNSVPFGTIDGRTAIGVEAASQTYFSKHASKLTLEQSALLAGLPQAPSLYNPFRNPSAAIERRNKVIAQMAKLGYISRARAERARSRGLGLKRGDLYTKRREPYFFDYVQDQLIERYGVGVFRRGGLKVHTTVEPKLQEAGRQAIEANLGQPGDPSSAVVSIDPKTGYITAMASSGTYDDRTFNLAAQGHRQPGSAFKTFVLATAIRKGVDPNSTTYVSKPLAIPIEGFGTYKVKTYDDSYLGTTNLVEATLKSDNTVYVQLDLDLGPDEVRETAKMMGITTKLDAVAAEGLGGLRLGVSPLEMANAYATLASGGIRNVPKAIKKVEFPDGTSEDLGKPERKRVFPDGVAYEVTKILEQNVQRGTGTSASIGCPAAGKTGTTDAFKDAWFVGYTPSLATSVWVGYPNEGREMTSVHGIRVAGGTFPAEIWGDYMEVANAGRCDSFPPPSQPVVFRPFFGKYASTGAPTTSSSGYSSSGSTDNNDSYDSSDGYDPSHYESSPTPSPSPSPTPSPSPSPSPSPPSGGGGDDDGGGNSGGGNSGGGTSPG